MEKQYESIGQEIQDIAKRVKKLSQETHAEERAGLAHDLRLCHQELFIKGSFAPALAERVNEYLETTLMPLLEDHLQNVFQELYVKSLSDNQVDRIREGVIEELRSEYEVPIRQQVAKDVESIKVRIRAEQAEAIRMELKEELRPSIREELRDELMKKLMQ